MFYFLYRYRNCGKWRQSKFCHDYLSYKKREDENLPFSVTPEGLEPSTQWLRVICSTSWATESFAGTKVMLFAEPTKVFCRFLFDEVNFFCFAGVLPRWIMALGESPSALLSGDSFPTLTRISFDEHDVIIRFDEEVDGMKFRVEVYTKISVIVFGSSCLLFWRLSFIHYTL